MKDQLPSPDPDKRQYVRPTQNWICGKASEGETCRIGPDCHGHCRATTECQPILQRKEGEAKGRYMCTRPKEYGGPCELGPMPDGSCGRPIIRCQPVRSLRGKRMVFNYFLVTGTLAFLLLTLGGERRWRFINPGPLSVQHSGDAYREQFKWLNVGAAASDPGCAACHVSARASSHGWVKTALTSNPGPLKFHTLALMTTADMTSIDENCERCHTGHKFHEPDVVMDHSCSACHQEHMGSGMMKLPTDENCAACHANEQVMQASIEKAAGLPLSAFNFRPDNGRTVYHPVRPAKGYTKVIHSFATDHPEFQVISDHVTDPDTLKFNHMKHLTAVKAPPGKEDLLKCETCHKLDSSGRYRQSVTFADNCAECHSLKFDTHNDNLVLPHGDASYVRDFLHSLPVQYAEYGIKEKKLGGKKLEAFVQDQMVSIRRQEISGEQLEHKVFFGDSQQVKAQFPACNYCHEVRANGDDAPLVTKPVLMDRWMSRGNFDHSKHLTVQCAQCHQAIGSAQTADVMLPSRATCVVCHSPSGGVANGCSTCHSYHAPTGSPALQAKVAGSDLKLADKK